MLKERNVFEILLTRDNAAELDWQRFCDVIVARVHGFRPVEIRISLEGKIVRYFALSKRDLSVLSQGLDGFFIRTVTDPETLRAVRAPVPMPIPLYRMRAKGSALNLRERIKIRKNLDLEFVRVRMTKFGHKIRCSSSAIFSSEFGGKRRCYQLTGSNFPVALMASDFAVDSGYIRKSAPKYVGVEKTAELFTSDASSAIFNVESFPYFARQYYLDLMSYDFDKHSFIIGASGSGKSKLIKLLVDRLRQTSIANNYRVVIIDPHASLEHDFYGDPATKIVNFSSEAAQLFPDAGADISAATELTSTLFKSLMSNQPSPRLERVLRFTLYVLFVAQTMSFDFMKKFLTDLETRSAVIDHVKGFVPTNVLQFFGADFNEIRTQYYNEAVQPIISFVDELQLQPTLVGENEIPLARTIEENFLTVFSLNKVSMGEKVTKAVAGLLIQQIFLMAQARSFHQKIILVVDEVSVVQNPSLASILAEARKFGLSVVLSQQYFGQIEKDLQAAILSNVMNYYVFRVWEEDAQVLSGNIAMDIPVDVLEREKIKGLEEEDVRVRIMTELSPRECLVRVSANGQLKPAILAQTVTVDIPDLTIEEGNEISDRNKSTLPNKYVHGAAPVRPAYVAQPLAKPVVAASTAPTPSVAPSPQVVPTSPSPSAKTADAKKTSMSLTEMLMQQSSTREPIKKRDDE